MSVTSVVDFSAPREIALSQIRRDAARARIRRAIWIALMMVATTAGIQGGILSLQLQYQAAQRAALAQAAHAK
jgi:hypothetical protein